MTITVLHKENIRTSVHVYLDEHLFKISTFCMLTYIVGW